MISFFPDPYPDELLYSVCARYHRRIRHRSKNYTLTDLFGEGARSISLLLPNRLDHLIAVLPPGHNYSADRLIDENTLLPFFGPFLPPYRLCLLRNSMRQKFSGTNTRGYAGISNGRLGNAYLRFCRLCAKEDVEIFGEPYWHRLHQVTGVEVCIRHELFLEPSRVGARMCRGNSEALITAEEALTNPRPSDGTSSDFSQVYVQLAQDVSWLLSQRGLSVESNNLHACYMCILLSKGMINRDAVRTFTLFRHRFEEYFTSDLLASFQCELKGCKHWLYDLLRGRSITDHPLRHILIIHFLGYTMEKFFSLFFTGNLKARRALI